jgi:anti-sigma B factor antagonist
MSRFVVCTQADKGGTVPLSLNARGVGDVTIVRCSGRIVAGGETESLRKHVSELLPDRSDVVPHLGEVVFIDSSGLGMLVRLLTSTRQARGDLKLCNLPESIPKILQMTSLMTLFDTHEPEEGAVLAFYRRQTAPARAPLGASPYCASINPWMCLLTCGSCCTAPATTSSPITISVIP